MRCMVHQCQDAHNCMARAIVVCYCQGGQRRQTTPLCAGRIPVHSVSKLRVCTSGGLACSFPGPLLSFFFTCFLKYMSKILPPVSSFLRPSCSQAGDRPISLFPPSFYLSLFLSVLSCDPLQPLPTVAGSLLVIAEIFTTTLCCWDLLFPPFPL